MCTFYIWGEVFFLTKIKIVRPWEKDLIQTLKKKMKSNKK